VSDESETVAILAAIVQGDRWLSADGCAAFLGGVKRRTFLERIACLPDFPAPAKIVGAGKLWLKSEVDEYAKRHRVSQAA
jgi:predicted DNA-binding transcriptional regulator AlpA